MSNCPCVPYGKKCMYEECVKNLLGCTCRILNYRLQELKMKLPLVGGLCKPYVCNFFMEEIIDEENAQWHTKRSLYDYRRIDDDQLDKC